MRSLLFCLLLIGLPAVAEVYTYIDAEGNRVFTDRPRSGSAERIQLAPANAMPAAPVVIAPPSPPQTVIAPAYQLLRILLPEPDATIRDNTGNLIVTLVSEPGLLAGHTYRLFVDGQPAGAPSRSPVFPLSNLDRGTHQLAAEIIDESGRILERTPNQPVHIKRISLAQKRLANPCKKDDYGVRPECPLKDKPKEKPSILPFL